MGSQRVPNKNFKDFSGKPLLLHSLEQALGSSLIDEVVVSTNNRRFVGSLPSELQQYFLFRPEELCASNQPGYTYVKHALEECERRSKMTFTHFVTLPPTSPLRKISDIDSALKLLLEDNSFDSVTSMTKVNHMYHGIKQKGVREDGTLYSFFEEENGRTSYQDLPNLVVRNCAIYASKVDIIKGKSMIGPKCRAYMMAPERSIDINEPIDFEFAEYLKNKISNY